MSDRSSWAAPLSDADVAAEARRERRRRWIRPQSLLVLVGVAAVDTAALLATSTVQSIVRQNEGRPCATFWADLSHDAITGIWTTLVVLGVILLLCAWRRWILIAAVVVQVAAVAILVPPQLHDHRLFAEVAAGRVPASEADSGGLACDQ